MKRSSITLLTTLVLLVFTFTASAQVIVPCPVPPCTVEACPPITDCPPIQPGVFTDPTWLKVDYHRVNVDIANQIATTNIDMQFTNTGEALAEGTFVFPLPEGAAVDELIMYVNGQAIEAKILAADEARNIYNEIVRQYRDPALLEYIGTSAIQANVFPIPPGESRRIEISYSQILEADNGLIKYVYPLNNAGITARVINQMSIRVNVTSNDEISTIYSPSHPVAISRASGNLGFSAGYEANSVVPENDFTMYYGIANDQISVNLLTYRESAREDGFFMLLVQPPVSVPADQIVPKDVIVVIDQSGSMDGEKWTQAQQAAIYVLENLNPNDHFNVVAFSTGWRIFGSENQPAAEAQGAVDWITGLHAEGGTDINGSLTTALDMAHAERPTTIIFLTDGLATEGEIESSKILDNLENAAKSNVRIFTFGIGDDVDTFLLDAIVRDHRGTGSYVRTGERIDEEVASLYTKISAPVLNDIALDFSGMQVELLYPNTLPDLFAGEQLTLVGRYRGDASDIDLKLSGTVNGQQQTFIYDGQDFRANAGGEPFIARLWATRRIGDLLNTIRLNGENPELVDAIVSLSIKYGIITPYTSFLIEEDDILTQQGRDRAMNSMGEEAEALSSTSSGAGAVDAADTAGSLAAAEAPMPLTMPSQPAGMGGGGGFDGDLQKSINPIQTVSGKTFILQGEVWTDTTFQPDTMETQKVVFLSDEYFNLLTENPNLSNFFAVGERLIVVVEGVAYEVVTE